MPRGKSPEELQQESEEESEQSGSGSGSDSDAEDGKADKASGSTAKLKASAQPELSRRERDQIVMQRVRNRTLISQDESKTTEAKADLVHLALIRQQREEAAKGGSKKPGAK